jgi:uncharacterized protein YwgA
MNSQTLENQAVIYSLIGSLRAKHNWCGETHIQKTIFFLEELGNHPLGYDFILYKHGPYSFALSEDLSGMGALRFIDEEIANPNYGPRLKQNLEVDQMLQNQFGGKLQPLRPAVDFIVSKLSDYGVATLERLATALYFTKNEPISGVESRAQKINEIKPHISITLALDAVKKVDDILLEWNQRFPQEAAA